MYTAANSEGPTVEEVKVARADMQARTFPASSGGETASARDWREGITTAEGEVTAVEMRKLIEVGEGIEAIR